MTSSTYFHINELSRETCTDRIAVTPSWLQIRRIISSFQYVPKSAKLKLNTLEDRYQFINQTPPTITSKLLDRHGTLAPGAERTNSRLLGRSGGGHLETGKDIRRGVIQCSRQGALTFLLSLHPNVIFVVSQGCMKLGPCLTSTGLYPKLAAMVSNVALKYTEGKWLPEIDKSDMHNAVVVVVIRRKDISAKVVIGLGMQGEEM